MQAQYAPSMYIGLWTRLSGFEREDLTRALENRQVAQGTLMRATIHLVSASDYWPIAGDPEGPPGALAQGEKSPARGDDHKADGRGRDPAGQRIAAGPMRRSEIHELLGENSIVTNGVNMWLDSSASLPRAPGSGGEPTSTRRRRIGSALEGHRG